MNHTTSQEQEALARHTRLLCDSYRHWTGMRLIEHDPGSPEGVEELLNAPFAVASHNTQDDPVFNYANNAALKLFGMEREEILGLPSRFSAEPAVHEERAGLLERVTKHGYVDDYSGIRIAKSGLRFLIRNAVVWNVIDEQGDYKGQAALIRDWAPV
ncbi:MAG TPA: MEKHLA domain-containing protein [Methylophilaceae bacterium]|nr:MEKHLA domain-containing protein [Methylophilaceae bacterium]